MGWHLGSPYGLLYQRRSGSRSRATAAGALGDAVRAPLTPRRRRARSTAVIERYGPYERQFAGAPWHPAPSSAARSLPSGDQSPGASVLRSPARLRSTPTLHPPERQARRRHHLPRPPRSDRRDRHQRYCRSSGHVRRTARRAVRTLTWGTCAPPSGWHGDSSTVSPDLRIGPRAGVRVRGSSCSWITESCRPSDAVMG